MNKNYRKIKKILKPKDKVISKMTKNGLVEQNLSSGENKIVSKRITDFNLHHNYETDIDMGASINNFMSDEFLDENLLKTDKKTNSLRYSQVGTKSVSSNN